MPSYISTNGGRTWENLDDFFYISEYPWYVRYEDLPKKYKDIYFPPGLNKQDEIIPLPQPIIERNIKV